jgi:hypothetical protein
VRPGLDRIRAVVRFNKPGPAGQEVDADELGSSALAGLRDRLSHGATLAAATWADYMAVSASRALGDAITNAARLDGASLEESIAAADAIRELQWLIAALRNVQWRCLWPTFGDAAALHEGAKLTLRGERAVQARGVAAVARRRPRQGASIAVVGGGRRIWPIAPGASIRTPCRPNAT